MMSASVQGDLALVQMALTWSVDGTARVWAAATGQEVLPPLRHEGPVLGAAFNAEENRILIWGGYTARVWDISRLLGGHLIQVACNLLPDCDISELEERYGIAIAEPICSPGTPAPVWTELED